MLFDLNFTHVKSACIFCGSLLWPTRIVCSCNQAVSRGQKSLAHLVDKFQVGYLFTLHVFLHFMITCPATKSLSNTNRMCFWFLWFFLNVILFGWTSVLKTQTNKGLYQHFGEGSGDVHNESNDRDYMMTTAAKAVWLWLRWAALLHIELPNNQQTKNLFFVCASLLWQKFHPLG